MKFFGENWKQWAGHGPVLSGHDPVSRRLLLKNSIFRPGPENLKIFGQVGAVSPENETPSAIFPKITRLPFQFYLFRFKNKGLGFSWEIGQIYQQYKCIYFPLH